MRSQWEARLIKLEERRRPSASHRGKEERDAMVHAFLSDPEKVAAMSADLLGTKIEDERPHAAALLAALRAGT